MSVKSVALVAALAVALIAGVAAFGRPFGDTLTAGPAAVEADGVDADHGLSSTVAPLPGCAEVFLPGAPVDTEGPDVACADTSGARRELAGIACRDGRYLWTPPVTTGASQGWGFARSTYHAVTGTLAADRGYQQSLRDCLT